MVKVFRYKNNIFIIILEYGEYIPYTACSTAKIMVMNKN